MTDRPRGAEGAGSSDAGLHVMIDGMNLQLEEGTGVATYARNLASCLHREGVRLSALYGRATPAYRDPLLREAAFLDTMERRRRSKTRWVWDLMRSFGTIAPSPIPESGLVLRDQLRERLPAGAAFHNIDSLFLRAGARFDLRMGFMEIAFPERIDVAHWTYPLPIRIRGARNVYTFHDLVPLKLPYATTDRKPRYWRLVSEIARRADHIVTVSEVSRRDILDMLPTTPDRVTNLYQSVELPRSEIEKSEADLTVDLRSLSEGSRRPLEHRGFYLFVGAVEPKKNLKRLISAYLASGVEQPLVVVGRKGWKYHDEIRMMERSPRIVYTGYLPQSQMLTLMRSARAVMFPSIYEGFGLPVIEAFLCGTPVLTANVSATAEVAGDAAMLVDPYDVRAIRDAIRALSAPDAGPLLADLIARGRERAKLFAPERIAPGFTGFYRRLIAG
jgi:glycosyltransferase involved in cell wall biosynthesis